MTCASKVTYMIHMHNSECMEMYLDNANFCADSTVISIMYKYVVSKYKNCHISNAFGAKNMRKTTASDICVAAAGQHTSAIKDITDAQVVGRASLCL